MRSRDLGLRLFVGLSAAACGSGGDDPEYRSVAKGEYVEVLQSTELDGEFCPGGATEIDRQIEELAAEFDVSIPDDYRLLARVEASESAVESNCELVDVSACFSPARGERPPVMSSGRYFVPHEVVHAVQRMRGGWPHVALREGEARLFQGLAHLSVANFCPGSRRGEAEILEALADSSSLGAYGVYHEVVARVYDAYGREGFDLLWSASVDDPSTDALLEAFEDLFGLSLFELMQQPSSTCQDMRPGCAGLEERRLTASGLTLPVPQSCGPGIIGLQTPADAEFPGKLEHSFLLEIAEAGDLTISFSGSGAGEIEIAACDGFDALPPFASEPVRYADENTNVAGTPKLFRFEPGQYRLIVTGLANDEPAQAHLDLAPLDE